MGVLLFYQMFYGTVIYFLSFFFNKRHHGKRWQEVAMFVGVSNGLWFLFPILGMHTCTQMIYTDSFGAFD